MMHRRSSWAEYGWINQHHWEGPVMPDDTHHVMPILAWYPACWRIQSLFWSSGQRCCPAFVPDWVHQHVPTLHPWKSLGPNPLWSKAYLPREKTEVVHVSRKVDGKRGLCLKTCYSTQFHGLSSFSPSIMGKNVDKPCKIGSVSSWLPGSNLRTSQPGDAQPGDTVIPNQIYKNPPVVSNF